jgi:hypothetical protein
VSAVFDEPGKLPDALPQAMLRDFSIFAISYP